MTIALAWALAIALAWFGAHRHATRCARCPVRSLCHHPEKKPCP